MTAILIAALALAGAAEDAGWEFLKEREGVRVYKKAIPNTKILAFRGEGLVHSTLAHIAGLRSDPELMKKNTPRLEDQAVFAESGPNTRFLWQHFKAPWPLKDRDFVMHVNVESDRVARSLTIKLRPAERPEAPPQDCCVRAEVRQGMWRYTAVKAGATYVECEIMMDPKGAVPAWVVNLVQRDWPLDTITSLRRVAAMANVPDHPDYVGWHDGLPP